MEDNIDMLDIDLSLDDAAPVMDTIPFDELAKDIVGNITFIIGVLMSFGFTISTPIHRSSEHLSGLPSHRICDSVRRETALCFRLLTLINQ